MTPSPEPVPADSTRSGTAQRTAQVIALAEMDDRAEAGGEAVIALRESPLHRVKARLTVCVGSATVTLGELLAAREQQVIPLDHDIGQPVDLLLEGHVVARGQLVAVDERFALRITELPVRLKP